MPMRLRAASLVLILASSSAPPPAAATEAPPEPAHLCTAILGAATIEAEYGAIAAAPAPPAIGSPLALALPAPESYASAPLVTNAPQSALPPGLGGERARILLQSLTVPGWGQATLGRHTAATVFGLIEVGIWASFTAFKVQESMRADSYVRTAQLFAGIDLKGRDEEFRRVVGQYPSSDDYNKYVVYRDAANLYYGDNASFDAYIAANSLSGNDAWAWQTADSYGSYQEQRKLTQRAGLRANTALGLAVANRIVSALHAARYAGQPSSHALRLELMPDADDPSSTRLALTTRF